MKTLLSPSTRRLMRVAQFSAIALASMQVVWAAGRIESVQGPVHIVDAQQNQRLAEKGARLEVRETLVTGASAEAVIVTDDQGLVHIRPDSRYTIEAYRARGDASDTFIARLLGGGVRKISGWIARTAPDNVRLSSATTTIGIRGTDYEVQIVDASPEPGTHTRVIDGAVSMGTDAGAIELLAGEHAVSAALGRLPVKRPTPDPAVFGEHALTAQVEQLKPTLRDAALQGPSATPAQPAPAPAPPERRSSACLPGSDAQRVVDDLMRAYERGNLAELQRLLDPQVPGLGRMLDSATRERQQQIRVSIRALDQTAQCGVDVASINFLWEKRSQSAVDLQPRLERGRAALLLVNDAQAGRPGWRVVSVAGQNPFVAVLRPPPRPQRPVEVPPPVANPVPPSPPTTPPPSTTPPPTSTPPSTTPPSTTPPPTTPPTAPPPSPPLGITAPPPPPPPTTAAP